MPSVSDKFYNVLETKENEFQASNYLQTLQMVLLNEDGRNWGKHNQICMVLDSLWDICRVEPTPQLQWTDFVKKKSK